MKTSLLPLVALAALAGLTITPARAEETAVDSVETASPAQEFEGLRLPSIPYFDAVRGLNQWDALKNLKIDTLLFPQQDSGHPLAVPPSGRASQAPEQQPG